eukprot:12918026-Prorocentrum_lima.AAC.1
MVAVVVSNGRPEPGNKVVQVMFANEDTKRLLNAVIYQSVLEGLSRHNEVADHWRTFLHPHAKVPAKAML